MTVTILEINLVLYVVVAVLAVGYGFWLRNIFKHQIDAKDATIQSKDAEIPRLRGESAPVIVCNYMKMRAHAEQLTRDIATLTQKAENSSKALPQDILGIELRTLEKIMDQMMSLTGKTIPPARPLDIAFLDTFNYVMGQTERQSAEYRKLVSDAFRGK